MAPRKACKRKVLAEKKSQPLTKKECSKKEKNENSEKKKKCDLVILDQKEWMPQAAEEFFERSDFSDLSEKLQKMDNQAVLIGPFRKLRGETDATGIDLIMLDREETDLPEMQTFLKCSYGRYAFWRDTPSDSNLMVVFVEMKTIPDVQVVGNTVSHALFDLCDRYSKYYDHPKASKLAKTEVHNMLLSAEPGIVNTIRRVTRDRKQYTIGGLMGPGLILTHSNGKCNYRVISENKKNIEIMLRCLSRVGIKEEEEKVMSVLAALRNEVMVRTDEGDFCNGLELGHLLFLVNKAVVLEDMQVLLTIAYRYLKRCDFEKILNLTVALRK